MRDTKDIIALIIGSIMFLGGIYGGIWIIQRSQLSEESKYLLYAALGIVVYIVIIIFAILEVDNPESKSILAKIFTFNSNKIFTFNIDSWDIFCGIWIGLLISPTLWALISALLILGLGLINNLYFIICIYFIITFLLFLSYSKKKLMNFLVFVILAIIFYWGFKGRNIFRIDVKVKFNDEIIYEN